MEKTFPYTVAINGGSLGALYAPAPWPLELHLAFAGTALQVSGSIKNALGNPAADVVFGLGTEDLSELERLLQTKFPAVGATGLSGQVQWEAGRLHISNLHGVMGESTLEGELPFDLTAAKPRLTGELLLPVLDLRPFLTSDAKPAQPAQPLDVAQSAADAQKPWRSWTSKATASRSWG